MWLRLVVGDTSTKCGLLLFTELNCRNPCLTGRDHCISNLLAGIRVPLGLSISEADERQRCSVNNLPFIYL